MDRLSEMEAFKTVVDQGGFTGAARKLGVSKSAVSKHVSSLEGRLGARLLNRTTRRVAPTDVGIAYYQRVCQVLNAAQEADQMVSDETSAPEGTLRIAVQDECSARLLSPRVADFLALYPGVALTLDPPGTVQARMSQSPAHDLLLRTGPFPRQTSGVRVLGDLRFRFVVAPDYLNGAPALARLEDLTSHALLRCAHDTFDDGLILRSRTGEVRRIMTPARLLAQDAEALIASAIKGLGVAFLPDFMTEAHRASGRLVEVVTDLPPQLAAFQAVCADPASPGPRVRAMIDHLRGALQDTAAPAAKVS